MSLYPIEFALEQERQASARLALLEEQQYWRNQIALHRSMGNSHFVAPGRVADPYLGLRQENASREPAYHPYSAPLYSPSPLPRPRIEDTRRYLKQTKSAPMNESSTGWTRSKPSFSSPTTGNTQGIRGPPVPAKQWENPSTRPKLSSSSPTTRSPSATILDKRGPPVPENEDEDKLNLFLAKRQTGDERANKKKSKYPHQLMEAMMLYEKNNRALNRHRIVPAFQWLDDGGGFVVFDMDTFHQHVLLPYGLLIDKHAKYSSFTRKMCRWGFARRRSKLGHRCFQHDLFREGRFDLCDRMRNNVKRI